MKTESKDTLIKINIIFWISIKIANLFQNHTTISRNPSEGRKRTETIMIRMITKKLIMSAPITLKTATPMKSIWKTPILSFTIILSISLRDSLNKK